MFRIKEVCLVVLHYIAGPSGIAIHLFSIRAGDPNFVLLTWLESRGAVVQGGQRQREHAELVFSCMELISVPVIEITKE